MTKEKAAEAIRSTIEPWVNVANTWAAEGDKIRKTALDNFNQAIDNNYKLAKETLAISTSMTAAGYKQLNNQVERAVEFYTAFVP